MRLGFWDGDLLIDRGVGLEIEDKGWDWDGGLHWNRQWDWIWKLEIGLKITYALLLGLFDGSGEAGLKKNFFYIKLLFDYLRRLEYFILMSKLEIVLFV